LPRRELIRYIREKKKAYKLGRIKFYLTHPQKAASKIMQKLGKGK
jgi:ubiquinone biosynthesis protein COQ9